MTQPRWSCGPASRLGLGGGSSWLVPKDHQFLVKRGPHFKHIVGKNNEYRAPTQQNELHEFLITYHNYTVNDVTIPNHHPRRLPSNGQVVRFPPDLYSSQLSKYHEPHYSPKFKARVAIEAIRADRTLSQLGSQFKVYPIQIAKWRKSALDQLPELFVDGRKGKSRNGEAHSVSSWRSRNGVRSAMIPKFTTLRSSTR
jgi:transposase-like protein